MNPWEWLMHRLFEHQAHLFAPHRDEDIRRQQRVENREHDLATRQDLISREAQLFSRRTDEGADGPSTL